MANRETPDSAVDTPQTKFTPSNSATPLLSNDAVLEPQTNQQLDPVLEQPDDQLLLEAYGLVNPGEHQCIAPFWRRDRLRKTSCIATFKDEVAWGDEPQVLVDEDTYNNMVPGLRLASMLLIKSEDFMTKVLCADVKRSNSPGLWDWIHLDTDHRCTEADKAKYHNCLIELEHVYRIFMGPDDRDKVFKEDLAHAWANVRGPRNGVHIHVCQLHPEYLAFFSRPDYDDLDPSLKHRALFSLAVTLVHEFTHTLFSYRVHTPKLWGNSHSLLKKDFWTSKTDIQFHTTSLEMELGRAWEYFFFGEIMDCIFKDAKFSFVNCHGISSRQWFYCKLGKGKPGSLGTTLVDDTVIQCMLAWEFGTACDSAQVLSTALDGGSLEALARVGELVAYVSQDFEAAVALASVMESNLRSRC